MLAVSAHILKLAKDPRPRIPLYRVHLYFWYANGMDVACCFLESDGKILIVARQNTKTQKYEWDIPADKVRANESSIDTAIRAVSTETGYCLVPHGLKSAGSFKFVSGNNEPYTMNAYKATVGSSTSMHSGNLHSEWATLAEVLKRDDLIKNFARLLQLMGYSH